MVINYIKILRRNTANFIEALSKNRSIRVYYKTTVPFSPTKNKNKYVRWWTWCFCLNEMSSHSFITRYFSDICCNETNLKVSTLVCIVCVSVLSLSVMFDSLQPYGLFPTMLLCPWAYSGKDTAMGCYAHLQGIFLTQISNPCLHVSCISSWNLYSWAQSALYIYSLFCTYCYFLEIYLSDGYLW